MGRCHDWLRSTRGGTCLESESKASVFWASLRTGQGYLALPQPYGLNAPRAGASFPALSPLGSRRRP